MSQDIHFAFAHPSERAAATEGAAPRDRISLRDHIVEVEIGAFQSERGHTQRVCFNVVVEVARAGDRIDDDVDRILSYDRVTEAIAFELAEERLNLLETLAERVAERILLEPQAMRVFVRIEKLDRGPGALGVEIVRSRGDLDPAHAAQLTGARPHPRVVYLSNAAIAAPHLTGWLDWLAGQAAPVVLCVGLPDGARPEADHPLAQRRVDLLAIEQNGWVLAARDPRCVVVGTLTELDWGMKHDQMSLWAPSKIVLDAVEGPKTRPRDSVALAAWFAGHIEASDFLVIGEDLPETQGLKARAVAVTQRHLA
ncbi:MAG: dihydroneopterin aldolase [Marinovum algicola]|jgi:dihydroneopterin aldolase|uniref:dihydroneopterin aldolase n=1 Tax=Marinovum algicola TaxID=42444 RepID=A0A975WDM7_9RHOB|nr:dihydroneopterin aldolase [Marinovum algicola]SEK02475.1 dihydroneopterin aldolase [Marinovum algicola]SLN74213.1 bifunctional dihydroneopterin aldolase/dihydroneopterin triphosphate 2'-epimerase [Marinovum algicola]